ncbi:MAG: NPCBM/NEW2 domain-containing protein [Calditrichaeota bacterium]|nr:NPCBM/NEW2 domain-containing protein [Calditrichota bacterium]
MLRYLSLALGLIGLVALSCSRRNPTNRAELTWPRPVPCRTADNANPELFVMTLGAVETPLADGIFYPEEDVVRLRDGTEIKDYFRQRHGITHYQPSDKSRFPLPPSGWCSWYFYYQEINAEEVRENAAWLGTHLKPFGARYCQIDDGWQGTGHGMGENRDWTTIDKRFPGGMDGLASFIKKQGLEPGLWLAPHGQSNAEVVKESGAFLLKPDGSSASDTWEGKYLVDPSTPKGHAYLENLFTTLRKWGYTYFKIDGQPIVIDEYRRKQQFMKNPTAGAPEELYRQTLRTIRQAIGPDTYLLGCWGIPLAGVGIMNGSRTGGDVVCDWRGFLTAVQATMRWYFLHNIAWYCDPDVMLLRPPLTLDMARAWATLQGLTGQALMASDRMPDLPPERVEILKRVFPAVDIRPLDLFPSQTNKPIWDLKVNHLGRQYDVVGLFNYDERNPVCLYLSWAELGLPEDGSMHVYDFWAEEYVGCWEKGIFVHLDPASCRVLTLVPAAEHPQLISTNRHITQGWVDLHELSYDSSRLVYSGKSEVVAGDRYELRFAFPRSGRTFRIKEAKAGNTTMEVRNHQGWATCSFTSPASQQVRWQVAFEPATCYSYPVESPRQLRARQTGLDCAEVSWNPVYSLNCGYLVSVNGELLGYTPLARVELRNLDLRATNAVSVATVWQDGTRSEEASIDLEGVLAVPEQVWLSEARPLRASSGWEAVQMDASVEGRNLSIAGRRFAKGIGTHAESDVVFRLGGSFSTLHGWVGVDDEVPKGRGSVVFAVFGDDRLLWRSSLMRGGQPPARMEVSVRGVHTLRLHVADGGDGIDYDHADWAELLVRR